MKKRKAIFFLPSAVLLLAFCIWTALVRTVDYNPVGPRDSFVGFSWLNLHFHNFTGTNFTLYTVTEWLGLVPIAVALAFAILGLCQLISRRSIFKVDRSIVFMGIFYIAVIAFYVFFEYATVNYRPVLIEGYLEASYPSSTTLLVCTVMPAGAIELWQRVKSPVSRYIIAAVISVFTAFMVLGRIISGVHWITDIVGGLLLSLSLVLAYFALVYKLNGAENTNSNKS